MPAEGRRRILLLNFAGGRFNGLRRYTDDLIAGFGSAAEIFTLESDGSNISLKDGSGISIFSSRLQERITWNRIYTNLAYARLLTFLVRQLGFQLIQVNCFEGHTFDVLDIAETLHIPVIYAAHDFELICPTHFLVDPEGNRCGMCTHGHEAVNCLETNSYLMSGQATAGQLLRFRNHIVGEVIPRLARVICPSQHARQRLLQLYPSLQDKMIVIPHGIGGTRHAAPVKDNEPDVLRVATVGAMHQLKGAGLLQSISALLDAQKFSLHHFGPTDRIIAGVTYHGDYDARNLPALLRENDIDIALKVSLLPETFSYTLSEVALAGIPVISHDSGALSERIRELKLGWVVPYNDAKGFAALLNDLHSDRVRLRQMQQQMRTHELGTLSDMASRYEEIYRDLTAGQPLGLSRGDAQLCEHFLRITSFTNQLRIDEQARQLNESNKSLEDSHKSLEDYHVNLVASRTNLIASNASLDASNDTIRHLQMMLHDWQMHAQRLENSLPMRLTRAVRRISGVDYLLRKLLAPLLRRARSR